MYKPFLFSFAVIFCVDVYVISAKEVSANDVAIAQPGISDFISLDTAEVKESHVNRSELEVARSYDCKNGKYMRKCDVEKTIPCVDETEVCVCNPEFAERYFGLCEYCNCGPGFNCTFKWENYYWMKDCICPKGFHKDKYKYNGKCIADCSKPCKNGGICSNDVCSCPLGTDGVLCEKILDCSTCVNRLEVDCLYDQLLSRSYCSCKNASLYYDYDRDICIPCPCERGSCSYETTAYNWKLQCDCYSGYMEYNGYCKECECGYGGECEFDKDGNKICSCPDGFYAKDGRCRFCGCKSGNYVKCEMIGNEKLCFCEKGFQSVLGHCEDIDECETSNTCHPSATCYNTYGSFECICPEGYKAHYSSNEEKGLICRDIDECKENADACFHGRFTKCVNLLGSYKCECIRGYEPFSYKVPPYETSCLKTTKSWRPALIVIATSCVLIGVSYFMHCYVKKRASRPNW